MNRIYHSLHIGTLSTWMSVVGFGAVGASVAPWQSTPPPGRDSAITIIDLIPSDFLIQQAALGDVDPGSNDDLSTPEPISAPPAPAEENLSAPPELEPLADLEMLPEIPDLPPLRQENQARMPASSTARSAETSTPSRASSSNQVSNRRGPNRHGEGSPSGRGTGGDPSASSRLAAGRMPAPTYPSSSKRKGESGSVTVSFTIGTHGKVISAHVFTPSPYPALNEAALSAVRRWKFPPGGVLKTQRRLDFVLK